MSHENKPRVICCFLFVSFFFSLQGKYQSEKEVITSLYEREAKVRQSQVSLHWLYTLTEWRLIALLIKSE